MEPFSSVEEAARRRKLADSIMIENPRSKHAYEVFECLISHARDCPTDMMCALMAAPSQTGKSTIIRAFVERKNTRAKRDAEEIPVLHVTLTSNLTRRDLAVNILQAIEKEGFSTGPHKGNEAALLQRVGVLLRATKTQLLVLDEFHHVVHSENQKAANSVGETIKHMLIERVCPIVLSGTELAQRPFDLNVQLSQRCMEALQLGPLQIRNLADRTLFAQFLNAYVSALEERGVVLGLKDFLSPDVAVQIFEVAGGVLGRACNLIKSAIQVAALRGDEQISVEDFAVATDRNFICWKLCERNPFAVRLTSSRVPQ